MCKEVIGGCTLYLGKMEDTIGNIQGIDHILTDPPYLYIKTHDFDKEFDEQIFFENTKRLLPDYGFIALFGRGTSFYRWNTYLAKMGFVFKEEIIWDKRYTTAPCIAISRVHETVSIHTKRIGKIHRTKVPYVEQKQHNLDSIVNDIKKIKSAIKTEAGLNKIITFLQGGDLCQFSEVSGGTGITVRADLPELPGEIKTLKSITGGMKEKSIIICSSPHHVRLHPTEKPVRLAERILALISDPGDTIYDPFMGSGSFGLACINTNRKYIGSEMKPEYFDIDCKRIEKAVKELQHGTV